MYGRPSEVSEYYYEYHTQARAHYYNHSMTYDSFGRIKTHIKTNQGLLNPDSIPLPFQGIIDLRPVTITYNFTYDDNDRLVYFVRNQFQEQVGTYQQDEQWKYDQQGMLIEHNFFEVGNDTIIKNPSVRRVVFRDSSERVERIEKYTYSFSEQGLALYEITEYSYNSGTMDTILTYQLTNGNPSLKRKEYDLQFKRFDPLNTDSCLFSSYTVEDALGQLTYYRFIYDEFDRMLKSFTISNVLDTISKSEWDYAPFRKSVNIYGDSLVTYFDETGYERYEEEFLYGSSLGVPANMNTRVLDQEKIRNGLLEIWDPVTLFYRKDTEYIYSYDVTASISMNQSFTKLYQFYPNPSSGTVYLDDIEQIVRIELTSSDGKTISLPISNSIYLGELKGIYVLSIFLDNGNCQRGKIILI